jgi:hypothetical protein
MVIGQQRVEEFGLLRWVAHGARWAGARVSNFVQTVTVHGRNLRSYGDIATQGVP